MDSPPCGLTQEHIEKYNRLDDSLRCTAEWANKNAVDKNGHRLICGESLGAHPKRPDALNSLSQIGQSLPLPPPASIKPLGSNDQILYEREKASIALFYMLENTLGTRITPFCDNCYGAGKTSLIWKFRTILDGIQDWEWPKRSQSLRDAIYVHVQFLESLTPLNFENPDEIDHMLLQRFTEVFTISLKDFNLVPASFDELIMTVNKRCGQYKLLVHMDDIGAYEHSEHAKNIIHRLWHIGEKFRYGSHYYVLTGRSSHLYTIGTSKFKENPRSFKCANLGELIPLPLLTINSIKLIFQEHSARLSPIIFNEIGEPQEKIVNHIFSFTGGVPRAINAAVLCYIQNNKFTLPTLSQVEDFILDNCTGPTLHHQDRAIFLYCLELSWAQISMTNEETILHQRVTAVIARLGIYRNYIENSSSYTLHFTLAIPLYLMRLFNWPYLSIMSTAEFEDKGQRLESGFRRILQLRMSMRATNWLELGLSFLDQTNVPFPEARVERSYVFPQIDKDSERTEIEVRTYMDEVHNAETISLSYTKFPSACLQWLYQEMKIGQYYQPLPMSSSADALIRCSFQTVVCFQFKNLQTPFSESSLEEEIVKCRVSGWNVFLVVVCTEGHLINGGNDFFESRNEVNVVLLSKNSVVRIFGAAALKNISSTTLYDDLAKRI